MGTRSMSAGSVDIHGLSDEDLYRQIVSYGVEIGPVVASTRFLYEKKLYELILSVNSTTHSVPEVLPHSPPAPAEPEVSSIIHQRVKESSPMRTEVTDGGARPNAAFSAPSGGPLAPADVTPLNEPHKPKKSKETKEIISEEPIEAAAPSSASRWTGDGSGAEAEDVFRTPASEVRARRALYSPSPSTPNTRLFSGFGNGSGSQAKNSSTPQMGQATKTTSRSNWILAFEIVVITVLLVVGYLFYQEMQSLDEAVKNDL